MLQHQDAGDINHKYAKSLIIYNNEPIICAGAEANIIKDGKVELCLKYTGIGQDIAGRQWKYAAVDDPKFDDSPFRLGYINGIEVPNEDGERLKVCLFSSRIPVRNFIQGLNDNNFFIQKGSNHTFKSICQFQPFVDMLKGKYPTFKAAWRDIDEKTRRIAYHRHWALGLGKLDQVELFYRGQLVGQGKTVKHVELAPKFQFLKEAYAISME